MKLTDKEKKRFWSKVRKGRKKGACWEWVAYNKSNGYGYFSFRGIPRTAHRITYLIKNGKWPNVIDHLCRNRSCVRLSHLKNGTIKDNNYSGNGWSGRNIRKTHCPKGHLLKTENLLKCRLPERICRLCVNIKAGIYKSKHRAKLAAKQRDYYRRMKCQKDQKETQCKTNAESNR